MLLLHVFYLQLDEFAVSLAQIEDIARMKRMDMDLDQVFILDHYQGFAHLRQLVFKTFIIEVLYLFISQSHDEFRTVAEFLVLEYGLGTVTEFHRYRAGSYRLTFKIEDETVDDLA